MSVHPPGAAPWGVDFERMIIVRPITWQEGFWAWEQALRCPGTAACCGWIDDAAPLIFRRLHRAAELGNSVGILFRPDHLRGQPSWADVSWRVQTIPVGVQPVAVTSVAASQHDLWTEVHTTKNSRAPNGSERKNTGLDRAACRRRFRVELLRCRGRISGGVAEVELAHEATAVPVVSAVARSATAMRDAFPQEAAGRAV
jgi:hypothetical protein